MGASEHGGERGAGKDAPHLAALLSMHHLEVEPRVYPSYMCSCESWHGAMGDDGGESDGMRDNETGWATHVAERLIAAGYGRVIPPDAGRTDQADASEGQRWLAEEREAVVWCVCDGAPDCHPEGSDGCHYVADVGEGT